MADNRYPPQNVYQHSLHPHYNQRPPAPQPAQPPPPPPQGSAPQPTPPLSRPRYPLRPTAQPARPNPYPSASQPIPQPVSTTPYSQQAVNATGAPPPGPPSAVVPPHPSYMSGASTMAATNASQLAQATPPPPTSGPPVQPSAPIPVQQLRPMPIQSQLNRVTQQAPSVQQQTHQQVPAHYLPQRPYPANPVSATANGIANMSLGGAAPTAPSAYPAQPQPPPTGPPGMLALPIGPSSNLPRPDMSGSAVAMRIARADAPPQPPKVDVPPNLPANAAPSPTVPVEPSACPTELFVPTDPRCVRVANLGFPTTRALGVKYNLPLGAVVQPMAELEEPVPVVNFGSTGIVRCRHCRTYINFCSLFLDGGRRWKCMMCGISNDVPVDYFAPLDQYGKRRDAAERPELHRGSVEFVAPAEYMVRPPMPPVYMFVLETTPATVNSGVLAAALNSIRNSIDSMPNEGRTRIAIITFDSAVQFYQLRPGPDAEPSVYVVSDIDDIFLPTPDEILAQLADCRPCFEKTLELIASTYTPFEGMVSSPSCLGAALQGAQKAMEFIGGKMVVVASSRPTAGPGALRDRGDNNILGTDRERAILRQESTFYRDLAVTMSKCQIGCDFFVCVPPPLQYLDLSSQLAVSKFTGGEVFYCPNFEAAKDAPRLQLAINRTLARESALEAVMRIRATKGVRCTKFSGRFFIRSTDLLAMPNVDADKSYAVQFSIEDVTLTDGPFCVQVALLYTTTSGERRIRVHTIALPLVNNIRDMMNRIDAPATSNILLRQAAEAMKDRNLDEVRKSMREKLVNALAKYREICRTQFPTLGGGGTTIMITEAMQMLPLYVHGIGRSPVLSRDVCGAFMYRFDDKTALVHDVDTMNVAESSALIYPNIVAVFPWPNVDNRPVKHPNGVPPSFSSLRPDTGVLIDDGRSITLWLGEAIVQPFLADLLGGVENIAKVDPRFFGVELMRRGAKAQGMVAQVFSAVKNLVSCRKPSVPVHIVMQNDRSAQARIEAMMCEERTASLMNYRDFMVDLQRAILHSSSR